MAGSADSLPAWIAAGVGAAASVFAGPATFKYLLAEQYKYDVVYSAVFDVASILTGLLFAFYGIIATSETQFMRAMRRTRTYARFKFELKLALILGAALVVVSIPMMVVEPAPIERTSMAAVCLAGWAAITAASLTLFVRVAAAFFLLVEDVPDRPLHGG